MLFTDDGFVTLNKLIVNTWAWIVLFDGVIKFDSIMVFVELALGVIVKLGFTLVDNDVFALNVDESTVKVLGIII